MKMTCLVPNSRQSYVYLVFAGSCCRGLEFVCEIFNQSLNFSFCLVDCLTALTSLFDRELAYGTCQTCNSAVPPEKLCAQLIEFLRVRGGKNFSPCFFEQFPQNDIGFVSYRHRVLHYVWPSFRRRKLQLKRPASHHI